MAAQKTETGADSCKQLDTIPFVHVVDYTALKQRDKLAPTSCLRLFQQMLQQVSKKDGQIVNRTAISMEPFFIASETD